jgi:hypothetical protein
MEFTIEGPLRNQFSVCVPILRALPDWVGIEKATLDYEKEIEQLPTFLARLGGAVTGFLSLKQHNPFSAKIYVMASGIGINVFSDYLIYSGITGKAPHLQ